MSENSDHDSPHSEQPVLAKDQADRIPLGTLRTFFSRLTINEWLTLLIAIGSLVISYLTYVNATDTRDIKNAVQNLSMLATQTALQAKAAQAQLVELRNSQRAWIGPEITIDGPLTIDKDGAADLPLKIELENSGRLPASQVFVAAHLYPFANNGPNGVTIGRQFALPPPCYTKDSMQIGRYVFPAQKVIVDKLNSHAQTGTFGVTTTVSLGALSTFQIMGCITYRSGADKIVHHTWINMQLDHESGFDPFFETKIGSYPAHTIKLIQFGTGLPNPD